MLRLFFLLAFFPSIAFAQTPPNYMIYASQAQCLQRSQQQCQALGCDGVNTIYWWACFNGPLKAGLVGPNAVPAGSYAMRVDASGSYGPTYQTPTSGGAFGLTTVEQGKLVTQAQIAPLLPAPIATAGQ